GPGDLLRRCLDPFPVGVPARAVGEASPRQPVPVGDLDGVHSGGVQRPGDAPHLVHSVTMPYRVHAVPEGDVLHVDGRPVLGLAGARPRRRLGRHELTPWVGAPRWAMRSATRSAADVMMSRFPAYAGR